MNKCVIITRVSSIEQVENHSLDSQEKACRDYAERNGLDVVEVFRIEGESAKGTVRPEFQKAVDWSTRNAKELGITHLVLYKLDRWARSAESHALLWGQLKGAGVKLCSTTEEIDESAFGNFLTTLAVAMAQLDNDQRSERTKVGMKAAAAMGRWTGKPPIGYLRPTDRKMGASLLPDPLRAPLVKMAFVRMALGTLSQKEVLDELSVLGLAMRSGKKMTRQRFGALLRNPVYKGRVVHESWGTDYPGDFDAIVSDELFDTVNALLDRGEGSGKRRSLNNPDFPLRRFVRCSRCGTGITGSTSKNSKGMPYPYYHCRTKGCGGVSIRQERLHELFEDLLRSHSMTTEALSLFHAVVEQAWDVRSHSQRDLHTGLERRREEVIQDQQSLLEKYIRGEGIDQSTYERQNAIFESQVSEIDRQLSMGGPHEFDLAQVLTFSEEFLTDLASCWNRLGPQQRPMFAASLYPEGLELANGAFGTVETPWLTWQNDMFTDAVHGLAVPTGFEPVSSP